jgi:hypothetical protein
MPSSGTNGHGTLLTHAQARHTLGGGTSRSGSPYCHRLRLLIGPSRSWAIPKVCSFSSLCYAPRNRATYGPNFSEGEFATWLEYTMKNEGLTVSVVSSALGVTPKSIYDRLRGKGPLHPNHVKGAIASVNESRRRETKSRENLMRHEKQSVRVLVDLLLPEAVARRVAHVPTECRERYRGRVKNITMRARRELDEYLKQDRVVVLRQETS